MEAVELLKTKLTQYVSNNLSKKEITEWIREEMYKMLRGDILRISNTVIWGMLTELEEIDCIDDASGLKLASQIAKVLSGDANYSFCFFMQISKEFVKNNLGETKEILIKYQKRNQLSKAEINELELLTHRIFIPPDTINAVLETQIIDLLKLGYNFIPEDGKVFFDLGHMVYVNEDSIFETDYLSKIITMLECYDGCRAFSIHITFNKGISNVSIQI